MRTSWSIYGHTAVAALLLLCQLPPTVLSAEQNLYDSIVRDCQALKANAGNVAALEDLHRVATATDDWRLQGAVFLTVAYAHLITNAPEKCEALVDELRNRDITNRYLVFAKKRFREGKCAACQGRGKHRIDGGGCLKCKGTGKCPNRLCDKGTLKYRGIRKKESRRKCPICMGTGRCPHCNGGKRTVRRCVTCNGSGAVHNQECIAEVFAMLLQDATRQAEDLNAIAAGTQKRRKRSAFGKFSRSVNSAVRNLKDREGN